MNRLILIIFLASSFAKAQNTLDGLPLDSSGLILFEEVIQVDGATKDELYYRASGWAAKAFDNSNEAIQEQNKDIGTILANGEIEIERTREFKYVGRGHEGAVRFFMELQFREGRYKYMFSGFLHKGLDIECGGIQQESKGLFCSSKTMNQIRKQTARQMNTLIESLKKEMMKEEEDW